MIPSPKGHGVLGAPTQRQGIARRCHLNHDERVRYGARLRVTSPGGVDG